MMVERLRELIAGGASYQEAVKQVRAQSVFTTHTPVPAGHDAFTIRPGRGLRRTGVGRDGHRPGGASSASAPTRPCRGSFT